MGYAYQLRGELTSASDPNSVYAFAFNGLAHAIGGPALVPARRESHPNR